jgi:hypothetical protein
MEAEMTDNELLLTEIKRIRETLGHHGDKLETLTEAFSKMAVQNEQIVNLQVQTNALWKKLDEMTGTNGVISKIRNHQAGCPKEEMHRTFKWMWAALGVHSVILVFIIGVLLKLSVA